MNIDFKLKIKNLKFEHNSGFTLVEVLVVIGVFATVGTIVSAILVSSLRGTNKTNAIITVKENGNHALFSMAKTIRYAKKFGGVIKTDNTLETNCSVPIVGDLTPTPAPVRYKGVKVTTFDENQITFACDSTENTITTQKNSDTPTPLLVNVSIVNSSCYFTCSQLGSSDFPAIGVNFSLTQAGTSTLAEKMVNPIEFRTTIIMRNLYK